MRSRSVAALVMIVATCGTYAGTAKSDLLPEYFAGSISMMLRPRNVLHSAAQASLYDYWGNVDYSTHWWANHEIPSTSAERSAVITTGEYWGFLDADGAAGQCYRSTIIMATYDPGPQQGYGSSEVCVPTGGGGAGCPELCLSDPELCSPDLTCSSPILIDLDGGGFKLTGANDPVRFDLNANGHPEETGWTESGSETAFLVLDLNSNGRIDDGRELFGNYTLLPDGNRAANGYVALEVYDEPAQGGNGDGRISADDAIYPRLQLWIDYNHNGMTDPGELLSLETAGVESIDLRYHKEKRVDRWGNAFRYRSSATLLNERGRRRRVDTYDVYFVRVQGQ
jgi:hypothetical protein